MRHQKKVILFLSAIFCFAFIQNVKAETTAFTVEQLESANSIENAILLENGGEYRYDGVLTTKQNPKSETFFKIPVASGERLGLHGIFGKENYTRPGLTFFRVTGDQFAKTVNMENEENTSVYYTVGNDVPTRAFADDMIYINLHFDNFAGHSEKGYQFTVGIDNKGDAGTRLDAADTVEAALVVKEGVYEQNFLTEAEDFANGGSKMYLADDDTDCYAIKFDTDKMVKVKITPDSDLGNSASALGLTVRDSDNTLKGKSSSRSGGAFFVDVEVSAGDTLYPCITDKTYSSFFGTYKMDISSIPIEKQDDKDNKGIVATGVDNDGMNKAPNEFVDNTTDLGEKVTNGVETAKKTVKVVIIGIVVIGFLLLFSIIAIIVHIIKNQKKKKSTEAVNPVATTNSEINTVQPTSVIQENINKKSTTQNIQSDDEKQ